jgi:hypothetical protein
MTIEQLEKFRQARPFRAFRIHMADGRHLDVKHPEYFARTPGGRTISIATGDEAFEIIDLLLVTSLERRNGKRGSRQAG